MTRSEVTIFNWMVSYIRLFMDFSRLNSSCRIPKWAFCFWIESMWNFLTDHTYIEEAIKAGRTTETWKMNIYRPYGPEHEAGGRKGRKKNLEQAPGIQWGAKMKGRSFLWEFLGDFSIDFDLTDLNIFFKWMTKSAINRRFTILALLF